MEYFHSVRLDQEKCKGCTNCIKHCPTEAIRVREGKARIIQERCIDCGECIRICPNRAKIAVGDGLEKIRGYRYKVALPAPSIYAQFYPEVPVPRILGAFLALGFDAVFEVALAAEVVAAATKDFLLKHRGPRPLISPACPAVVSLIQVRFPALVDQIAPLETPMDAAARLARSKAVAEMGLRPEEVGTFFISPCPAKITAVRQPPTGLLSQVDGVLPLAAIYPDLLRASETAREVDPVAGPRGVGWGVSGGENASIGLNRLLHVDGIHHVINVLEGVEKGEVTDIDYIEAQACPGGCVGGALMVKNPFVARQALTRALASLELGPGYSPEELEARVAEGECQVAGRVKPRPALALDADLDNAIAKMKLLEDTLATLPGLDCGSCGSPNCRALAEDIVRGQAQDTDCVFRLRERVRILAEEVVELARKLPPSMAGK
ncbi:MAG: hypothetical protein PWP65_989 [Clostridia bacterium]|nr:hypothetical protein [Clostridia bacterium]